MMDRYAESKSKLNDVYKCFECSKCSRLPQGGIWMLICDHKYCEACFGTLTLKPGAVKKCVVCRRLSPTDGCSSPDEYTTKLLEDILKYHRKFKDELGDIDGDPRLLGTTILSGSPTDEEPLVEPTVEKIPERKDSMTKNLPKPAGETNPPAGTSRKRDKMTPLTLALFGLSDEEEPIVEPESSKIEELPAGGDTSKPIPFDCSVEFGRPIARSRKSVGKTSTSVAMEVPVLSDEEMEATEEAFPVPAGRTSRRNESKKFLVPDVPSPPLTELARRTGPSKRVDLSKPNPPLSVTPHAAPKRKKFFKTKETAVTPTVEAASPSLAPTEKVAETPRSSRIRNTSTLSITTSSASRSPTPTAVNRKNARGETPLHIAAKTGQIEKANQLLDMGADIEATDFAGWRPLHEAVTGKTANALPMVEILLRKDAQVNIVGGFGNTPLHEAALIGNLALAKLLLSYGASKDIPNDNNLLPADLAPTRKIREAIISYKGPYKPKLEAASASSITISKIRESKILLYFTYKADPQFVKELTTCFTKLKIASEFSRDVTHVIFDVAPKAQVPLTLNYLYGMLTGAWLLSEKWLHDSLPGKNLVDLEPFEIDGYVKSPSRDEDVPVGGSEAQKRSRLNRERKDPGLFHGFQFFIYKNSSYNSDGLKINKQDLGVCMRLGDGQVLNREPNPDMVNPLDNLERFHVKEDPSHGLVLTSHIILFGERNEPTKKHNLEHVKTLRVNWLIESGLNFGLCDPQPFVN